MIKVSNTLSKKKEELIPLNKGEIKMYSCGPTVYNYAHIGNLRAYIFNDTLRRLIKYNNLKLTHVMNITDVGHLTSDADDGEDKMLKGAKREKKTVLEISQFYTDAFFDDMNKLNIEKPDIICKATEHIKEMIELNKKIQNNGFAYFEGGNLYFDTSKFKDYGKMANLNLEEQKEGVNFRANIDTNKRNKTDFVLWFTKSKFQDQEMKWGSPWGEGYPGWHIECAAMSIKYLGEQFDIHTGGIDHIPLHHTNEIAEAEAATGKSPWVKYWMHNEFLIEKEGKMSKSKGDFLRLQSLIDKGYNPLNYRYFCLNTHYKTPLSFTWKALDAAKTTYERLKENIIKIKEDLNEELQQEIFNNYKEEFIKNINDDLNLPRVLGLVWECLKETKINNKTKYEIILEFDKILGLGIKDMEKEEINIPQEIKDLAEERETARKEKDWVKSDKLRDQIKEKGFSIKDSKEGYEITK